MKKRLLPVLLMIVVMVAGCDYIDSEQGGLPDIEDDRTKKDSVLSVKQLGSVPGRAILDHSPRTSDDPMDVGVENPDVESYTPEDDDESEEADDDGEEDPGLSEDLREEYEDVKEEEEAEEESEESPYLEGKPLEELTPVKDYLVDYEKEGRWVREILHKDGDRYNHPMLETVPNESLRLQARDYFKYMTEINDYLGGIKGFDDSNTDLTLRFEYQYKDTELMVYYFREYIPKTLITTGNEGMVVLDYDGKLVHYLAFGRRNPNVLEYEPRYDQKTAEKLVWKKFNDKLHGYVDDYLLTDLYLKIPTEGDYTQMPKEFRPQWFAEFRNEGNSYLIPYPDYRK